MKYIAPCATILTLVCAFLLFGCKQPSEELGSTRRAVEHGLLPTFVIQGRPISKMTLTDRMKWYSVPGVSITVINNETIEWAQGYGVVEAGRSKSVTTESLFQAASISKLVTAMAALSLVQSGKIELDEDVNLKLRSWKVPENQYTREKKVTLRGLLTHTAGLTGKSFRGYADNENVPTLIQILDGQEPANSEPIRVDTTPGSLWRYSGGGYLVIQQLLEDITGKPFPELIRNLIFEKLGMKCSTFEQPLPQSLAVSAATGHMLDGRPIKGKWYTYPEMAAAGLWTTPSDLARFAIELQQSKAKRSNKVLSAEMTKAMLTPQIRNMGFGPIIGASGGTTWFSFGGSNVGFRCFMAAFTETGQGAVVMTNSDNGQFLIMEIVRGIAHVYDWPDFRVQEKVAANIDPVVYNAYEGEYEFVILPEVTISITKEGQQLMAEFQGGKFELHPESETKYFELESGLVIIFVKDAEGNVNDLILNLPLSSQKWEAKRRR